MDEATIVLKAIANRPTVLASPAAVNEAAVTLDTAPDEVNREALAAALEIKPFWEAEVRQQTEVEMLLLFSS